jgi:N-glycosylase/DNA lyase
LKLTRKTSLELEPIPPYSFRLTVMKPGGWELFTPNEIYEGDTLWTGIRFHGRPIGLKIQSAGTVESPRVLVGVYAGTGVSRKDMEALGGVLSVCLGVGQDLNEFYSFAKKDAILKHVVEDLYGMHDTQAASLFNSVILSVCLQMARLKRSNEMMAAIDKKYGEPIEFDGRRLVIQPAAETIAELDPKALAAECKLGYRAKYLVASARLIAGGFPDIQEIVKMSPDEAKEKLMELPGIGDYAADIINPQAGFPIDAWSVDVFGRLFFGKEPEDRRKAIETVKQEGIKRWGTWSWMAFYYVAQDLRNLSKRLGVPLRLE